MLVKILFPEEKLSVQVHPDDEQAVEMGETRGKTECWYVLEAEAGATVALGLKDGVGAKELEASVADGTMESLMQHVPVSVGDMLFVDAGTVHAIGPGVVLLETQQTSDVTYRLYDYGRPRELHLDKGLRVMKSTTKAGKIAPVSKDGFTRLIEQKYFVVDRFDIGDGEVGGDVRWAGLSGRAEGPRHGALRRRRGDSRDGEGSRCARWQRVCDAQRIGTVVCRLCGSGLLIVVAGETVPISLETHSSRWPRYEVA